MIFFVFIFLFQIFFFPGIEETVDLVKGIGGSAYGFKCDLTNKDDVYEIANKTKQEVGDVSRRTILKNLHKNLLIK